MICSVGQTAAVQTSDLQSLRRNSTKYHITQTVMQCSSLHCPAHTQKLLTFQYQLQGQSLSQTQISAENGAIWKT